MNISKLTTLTLIPVSLVLLSGCHSLKKTDTSATSTAAPAPMASAPAEAPAAAAPVAAAPKPPVMDDVKVSSTPSGAMVVINGNEVGVTPLVATVDRSKSYILTVKQAGYDLDTRVLKAHWYLFKGTRMPAEVAVNLASTKDAAKSLQATMGSLDSQLKSKSIDVNQHNEQLAEAARFYSQSK